MATPSAYTPGNTSTELSPQKLAHILVSSVLEVHELTEGRSKSKTQTCLESQIISYLTLKQSEGIPINESLTQKAVVMIINSLITRRLGRFKEKQRAVEGEAWVKDEWKKLRSPATDQVQPPQLVVGLKRSREEVEHERSMMKRVKPSCLEPKVGPVNTGQGANTTKALTGTVPATPAPLLPVRTKGLKRTSGDMAVEVDREVKRLKSGDSDDN